MDDQEFRQLLDRLGLSWRGYRKVRKGVKRRIRRHMKILGCEDMRSYLFLLDQDTEARAELERLMTVSISRFFRDRQMWRTLMETILPRLIEKHRGKLRVWSAGCASGEEVYSFKILWELLKETSECLPELETMATDLNPDTLERARVGIYPVSSLKEMPAAWRETFFTVVSPEKLYGIRECLKGNITWLEQSLFSDPPGFQFHVIFLRNNLLTYYERDRKDPALAKIVNRLLPGGYLIIGSHERLPARSLHLRPSHSSPCLFQKQG